MWFRWLGLCPPRATENERASSLGSPPLEAHANPDEAPTFVAGGRELNAALPIETEAYSGAVYSSRGRRYAPYNEDGAFLFPLSVGGVALGVFDQAGGLGGEIRGAASGLAASRAARALASLDPSQTRPDLDGFLLAAFEDIHYALVERGQREVTTGVVGWVDRSGRVTIVSSGDSGGYGFDAHGKLQVETPIHQATSAWGPGLTHALGLETEGSGAETRSYTLEPGGGLLFATDGLLDSGFSPEDVWSRVTRAQSVEKGLNGVIHEVLRRMRWGTAKPDNLTVVCVRRR